MPRTRTVESGFRVLLTGLLAMTIAVCGCDDSQRTGSLSRAINAYDLGRFDESHGAAIDAMRGSQGVDRDMAAYVAGMSAFQSGDLTEAEVRFLSSEQSRDGIVAGRSKAGLGLVRLQQHRLSDASLYFRQAAEKLPAVESREAQRQAELLTGAGGTAAADGRNGGLSSSSARMWTQSSTGFAIQVGAFENVSNAREAAASAQPIANRFRLGSVRVVARANTARPMYVVQFGSFSSRDDAESMLQRLARSTYVVAPFASVG